MVRHVYVTPIIHKLNFKTLLSLLCSCTTSADASRFLTDINGATVTCHETRSVSHINGNSSLSRHDSDVTSDNMIRRIVMERFLG